MLFSVFTQWIKSLTLKIYLKPVEHYTFTVLYLVVSVAKFLNLTAHKTVFPMKMCTNLYFVIMPKHNGLSGQHLTLFIFV